MLLNQETKALNSTMNCLPALYIFHSMKKIWLY